MGYILRLQRFTWRLISTSLTAHLAHDVIAMLSVPILTQFNASCSKLLLFKGFSAILVYYF